jgi:hypothetical protein
MSRLRFWRFGLTFAVLYGLLILPWPGLHNAIGAYVQAFGSRVFGQSGRTFMDNLAKNRTGIVTTPIHHIVFFRPIGPIDKSYSSGTDTIVLLYNFDAVDKSKGGGYKIGLESKTYFWLPFAFYLALIGATPMPWRRRAWALFLGFLTANILLALTLAVYIASHASDISMIALSPFWKWAVHGLTNLLLVVSGPSTFIYLLLWPFACFCREDLIRFVPGRCASTPKIVVIQTPIRQQDQRAVVRSRSSIS